MRAVITLALLGALAGLPAAGAAASCTDTSDDLPRPLERKLEGWMKDNGIDSIGTSCRIGRTTFVLLVPSAGRIAQGLYLYDAAGGDPTRLVGGSPGVVGTVTDKAGTPHLIVRSVDMTRGVMWEGYLLVDLRTRATKELFSGEQDGESGGCSRHELLRISRATRAATVEMGDANGDGVTDIVIQAEEEECKTERIVAVTQTFTAMAPGFATGLPQIREVSPPRRAEPAPGGPPPVARVLGRHEPAVWGTTFSPDGRVLLSVGGGGTVKWWDLLAGREAGAIEEPIFRRAQVSPDGRFLALGGAKSYVGEMVSLREMSGGREIWRATYKAGMSAHIYSLAFSPDGRRLLVAGADGTLRLWDTATGRQLRGFTGYPEYAKEVAFAADGRSFLVGAGSVLRVVDAASGMTRATVHGPARTRIVGFSTDQRFVLSISRRTTVLWDAATGTEVRAFTGEAEDLVNAALSPDGRLVATTTGRGDVWLWNLGTGKPIHVLHRGTASGALAFAPDGRQLATGPSGRVVLWQVGP